MKPPPIFSCSVAPLTALALACAAIAPANADPLTWDGNGSTVPNPNGGSGVWDANTTANWWDGLANVNWPGAGADNDAVFAATAGTVTIAAGGVTANDLTFNTTGYKISGGALTLNGTAPTLTADPGVTADIYSVVSGWTELVKAGAGTVNLRGANSLSSGVSITVQSGVLDFYTSLSGGIHSITKEGAGMLTIRGGSFGDLTANAGTVDIYNPTTSGNVTFAGSSVISTHSGTTWNIDSLTYSSSVNSQITAYSANGTLTIGSGGLSMTTDRTITLLAANAGVSNKLVLNGNATITASGSLVSSTSGSTLGSMMVDLGGADRDFDVSTGNTFTLGSAVQNGGITKTGDGAMKLTGATANTYTGMTTVSAGKLVLGKTAGVDAIAGNVTVQTGGLLDWDAANQLANTAHIFLDGGSLQFDGQAETFANLTQTAGTVNFGGGSNGGMVTITGALNVSGGSSINLNSGGVWSVGSADFTGHAGTAIAMNGNNANMNEFTVGSGGLILTGQNIVLNKGVGIGTSGSQLTLNGNVTASGTNNITVGGGAEGVAQVQLGAADRTWTITGGATTSNAAVVSTGGGLVKEGAGTLVLNGANTYTGATTVNGGTLRIAGDSSGATGAVNLSAGGIVEITSTGTLGATSIGGLGTVLNNGAMNGALNVGADSTVGGAGGFSGLVTVASGGTISPGNSPGVQTYAAGLTMNTGSTFTWELVGDTTSGRGTSFDGVDVTGGALTVENGVDFDFIFNGTGSNVDFTSAFWESNQSWLLFDNANAPSLNSATVFDLGTISADASGALLSTVNPLGRFSFSQTGNDIYLNYTAVPEPATTGLLALLLGGWLTFFRRRRLVGNRGNSTAKGSHD